MLTPASNDKNSCQAHIVLYTELKNYVITWSLLAAQKILLLDNKNKLHALMWRLTPIRQAYIGHDYYLLAFHIDLYLLNKYNMYNKFISSPYSERNFKFLSKVSLSLCYWSKLWQTIRLASWLNHYLPVYYNIYIADTTFVQQTFNSTKTE